MAMIDCPECSASISDAALSCPKCGNPMAEVITTQQTSKRFKVVQLIAVAFMFAGMVSCSAGGEGSAHLWMAGISLYIAAKTGAWWRNG